MPSTSTPRLPFRATAEGVGSSIPLGVVTTPRQPGKCHGVVANSLLPYLRLEPQDLSRLALASHRLKPPGSKANMPFAEDAEKMRRVWRRQRPAHRCQQRASCSFSMVSPCCLSYRIGFMKFHGTARSSVQKCRWRCTRPPSSHGSGSSQSTVGTNSDHVGEPGSCPLLAARQLLEEKGRGRGRAAWKAAGHALKI